MKANESELPRLKFTVPRPSGDLLGNILNPALFYPGSGSDFEPAFRFLEHSNISTIVYCDYTLSGIGDGSADSYKRIVPIEFHGVQGFRDIKPSDLKARSWANFWNKSPKSHEYAKPEGCFGFWSIFENNGERKCFVFLKTEALGTYRILWGRHGAKPACIYIKDHGFGLNWSQFSGEKGLYQEAKHNPPDYLCEANNNDPGWPGYVQMGGVPYLPGSLYHLTKCP